MQEMEEMGVRSLGPEDPLEEGMTTHSSIPAQRIPRTEEPGGATFHGVAEPDTTEVTYHALSVSTFGLFVS